MAEQPSNHDFSLVPTPDLKEQIRQQREVLKLYEAELRHRDVELSQRSRCGMVPLGEYNPNELSREDLLKLLLVKGALELVGELKLGDYRGKYFPFTTDGRDIICSTGRSFMDVVEGTLRNVPASEVHLQPSKYKQRPLTLSAKSLTGRCDPLRGNEGVFVECLVGLLPDRECPLQQFPYNVRTITLVTPQIDEYEQMDPVTYRFDCQTRSLTFGIPRWREQDGLMEIPWDTASSRLLLLRRLVNKL